MLIYTDQVTIGIFIISCTSTLGKITSGMKKLCGSLFFIKEVYRNISGGPNSPLVASMIEFYEIVVSDFRIRNMFFFLLAFVNTIIAQQL